MRGKKRKKENEQPFAERADLFLVHVRDHVECMEYAKREEAFNIAHFAGDRLQIDLAPELGSFTIMIDEQDEKIMMSSPVSGVRDYVWNSHTGAWVGIDDYEVRVLTIQ